MTNTYLIHHGILGQKWGVRRYQNPDGTLTEEGKKRYLNPNGTLTEEGTKKFSERLKSVLNESYQIHKSNMDTALATIPGADARTRLAMMAAAEIVLKNNNKKYRDLVNESKYLEKLLERELHT